MPKYPSLAAISWSLNALGGGCEALFADFLITKREGLVPGQTVTLDTGSTRASTESLMAVRDAAGEALVEGRPYYNPFASRSAWRKKTYPRYGTYTNLESPTFNDIVEITKSGGEGMNVSLSPNYLSALPVKLRRGTKLPFNVSEIALAVWTSRYDELPDDPSIHNLLTRFRSEYNITVDEHSAFFNGIGLPGGVQIEADTRIEPEKLKLILLSLSPVARSILPAPAVEASSPEGSEIGEDLLAYISGDLLIPRGVIRQLVTLLRSGKHLILTGPPGTGKSTLAYRLGEVSRRGTEGYTFPRSSGLITTTATSDWTTFETIGGYVPSGKPGGELSFSEGFFLKSLRDNAWLVIDEVNRADVDKAFGQFFTVLSGHSVDLPFRVGGKDLKVIVDRNASISRVSEESDTYSVGRDWRIICTMNTFDRTALYHLSSAFIRRFATVHVSVPPLASLQAWASQFTLEDSTLEALLRVIGLVHAFRPLGPAIWVDVIEYLAAGAPVDVSAPEDGSSRLAEAVAAYVLPQLGGLDQESLEQLHEQLAQALEGENDRAFLQGLFFELG